MDMHTPGPWMQNVLLVQDADGEQIAHCTRWERGRPMPEVAEANARLIAAAPELLDVVKRLMTLYTHFDAERPISAITAAFDAARAVIQKVERV